MQRLIVKMKTSKYHDGVKRNSKTICLKDNTGDNLFVNFDFIHPGHANQPTQLPPTDSKTRITDYFSTSESR